MATVAGMPPILRLKRSAQSGNKLMTAAWVVEYTENTSANELAYLFAGATLDLSTMAAGDTIDVRIRKVVIAGGAWVNHDQVQYTGARPAGHPTVHIAGLPDVYGVEISMRQTAVAVAFLQVAFEAYDAKRLGLV